MDKGKRNSFTPKGPNSQGVTPNPKSSLKNRNSIGNGEEGTNSQVITPKSSLKKRDSIGNVEEKKVRFTGKLVPEHTPTAKTTPKILVKEVVDSDDDTIVTPSGKQFPKKAQKTTPSQLTNKQMLPVQNVKPSPQSKSGPINKNGNVPHSRKRKASESDEESSEDDDDDEDDDSDDDSDLAALWAESDDGSELDVMEDFFEDDDDSEDEKPSTVVIEEIKDDKKLSEFKTAKTETSLSDSKLARKASVKRRADDDLEPPAKRSAPAAAAPTVSPTKKPKTEDANNNSPQKSDKSRTPKEKKAKPSKPTAVPSSSGRKSIKKSVNERLAPYKGKCSPEEYKKLKKKFQAQERKRRSRLEKLQKATSLKNVPLDDREALIKMTDERMDELRKRVLYVRPIPSKVNAAMLKKALPSITGCRIPPKLESKKVKGKKNLQAECIVYGRARGYAFLEFASAEEAKRQLSVLQSRNEPLVARSSSETSQPLKVRLGEERASEKRSAKTGKSAAKKQSSAAKRAKICDFMSLHVGGLPCHAQLQQVKELLQCDRVDMPVVADGNLGFCMAHYNKVEDAVKVFREKHGVTYHGCKLWIAFSLKSVTKKVK